MRYGEIVFGVFVDRPNRFIAHVEIDGTVETVHVKNTGRCRELLVPGCRVVLERAANPNRKTAYDLIAVYKVCPGHEDGWLFNIDSQAPNKAVGEWLAEQGYDFVKPEHTYKSSRFDFMMQRGEDRYLLEVKGCTLEIDGVGYFPDAPTARGVKHLDELSEAAGEGWHAALAFVIAMEGVGEVRPNMETHPDFGRALESARRAGVEILFLECEVAPDSLKIKALH